MFSGFLTPNQGDNPVLCSKRHRITRAEAGSRFDADSHRGVLSLWLERFSRHGNGIALVPERTQPNGGKPSSLVLT
jgi:hypothetical protein